jgi:hypothetical protein
MWWISLDLYRVEYILTTDGYMWDNLRGDKMKNSKFHDEVGEAIESLIKKGQIRVSGQKWCPIDQKMVDIYVPTLSGMIDNILQEEGTKLEYINEVFYPKKDTK